MPSCSPELAAFGARLHAFLGNGLINRKWWTHGGCWKLASALHQYLGDDRTELWGVGDPLAGIAYHVSVRIGDCFIDADGASSEQELLARWRKIYPGRVLIVRKLTRFEVEHFSCEESFHTDEMYDRFENEFGPSEVLWRSIFS